MTAAGATLGLFLVTRYWITEHSENEAEGVRGRRQESQRMTKVSPPPISSEDHRPNGTDVNNYSLFGPGGKTSEGALKAAGLSSSSGYLVQQIFQDVLVAVQKDLGSRVVAQTDQTDESKGIHVFHIKGDPEKSEAYIEQIRQWLAKAFGGKAADKLLVGLRRSISPRKFGKNDAVITIENGGRECLQQDQDRIFRRRFREVCRRMAGDRERLSEGVS